MTIHPRKIIQIAPLLLASQAWARFEDLWGEEEQIVAGQFSDETKLLIYILIVSAGLLIFGGRMLKIIGAIVFCSAPVLYFIWPIGLAFYAFAPFIWYFLFYKPK